MINLKLPTLYDKQVAIANNQSKRKVVAAGRRAGKTILGGSMAIGGQPEYGLTNGLLDGKRVLLSSTSQEQSDVFWEYIVNWLSPLIGHKAFYKNEVRRIIKLGKGQIRVKTGRNPDALRGDHTDNLILDECAYLDPRAWAQVGAPMLADSEGDAIFFSTPKRRNWFFDLYLRGKDPENKDWESWNFGSHVNPHLSKSALDRLITDMTEEDYQQEILAQFLAGSGAVFRNVEECCTATIRTPYPGVFVMGIDWAREKDYTVIMVMDVQTNTIVDYDRFNGVSWSLQRGRVESMYRKWDIHKILAEENSIGSPNIEALQDSGLPVRSFMTTASSKSPLIESLVLAIERGEITGLNDAVIKGELMSYERTITKTGRSQYSAPPGKALTWKASIPDFEYGYNPTYDHRG
jgi:hypothetical protein